MEFYFNIMPKTMNKLSFILSLFLTISSAFSNTAVAESITSIEPIVQKIALPNKGFAFGALTNLIEYIMSNSESTQHLRSHIPHFEATIEEFATCWIAVNNNLKNLLRVQKQEEPNNTEVAAHYATVDNAFSSMLEAYRSFRSDEALYDAAFEKSTLDKIIMGINATKSVMQERGIVLFSDNGVALFWDDSWKEAIENDMKRIDWSSSIQRK